MREPWVIRQAEANAMLPWRSRLRRSATYAGALWVITVAGSVVLKYGFDVIDRPILSVLAQSTALPLVLFGCFTYLYCRADLAKRLHDQKIQRHENA